MITQEARITELSHRDNLERANELRVIINESEWSKLDLHWKILTQHSRSFPHSYETFVTKINNPGRMARHLADHPELYDLIKSILATKPERG